MTVATSGYRRILVAIDFSAHAGAALRQAVWLARQSGASITLVHALPDVRQAICNTSVQARLDLFYGEGDVFQHEVRRESDAKMRQMLADLGAADLNVGVETLLGEPIVQLIHAVQAERYDLVLAGTRGRSAWEEFFVGSNAKRLIRKCPSSVWVVKAEHVGPPKAVLAATDFSDVSLKAAAYGLWVARQAGAEFHLLHLIDSTHLPEELMSRLPHGSSLRDEINQEATIRLESFLDSLQADRDKAQIHLSWGTPWKEIKRLSEHVAADLVTIGTVGRSAIKGILLGNTAEKILAACDSSILTVKPDDFVSPIEPPFWPLHPEGDG